MTAKKEPEQLKLQANEPVRVRRQKENQVSESRVRKQRKQKQGGFVTWSPSEVDYPALERLVSSPDILADYLTNAIERGCAISLKYSDQSDSVGAIARDAYAKWNQGTALSSWHDDAWKALTKLLYALHNVYPDYPATNPIPEMPDEGDW